MTYELFLKLDDDDSSDHEARRSINESLNLGSNFFNPDKLQPFGVFKDHRTPISLRQLRLCRDSASEAATVAQRAAQRYGVEITLQKQKGLTGDELARVERQAMEMEAVVSRTAERLRDVRNLMVKWIADLNSKAKALHVGSAALESLRTAPQV